MHSIEIHAAVLLSVRNLNAQGVKFQMIKFKQPGNYVFSRGVMWRKAQLKTWRQLEGAHIIVHCRNYAPQNFEYNYKRWLISSASTHKKQNAYTRICFSLLAHKLEHAWRETSVHNNTSRTFSHKSSVLHSLRACTEHLRHQGENIRIYMRTCFSEVWLQCSRDLQKFANAWSISQILISSCADENSGSRTELFLRQLNVSHEGRVF